MELKATCVFPTKNTVYKRYPVTLIFLLSSYIYVYPKFLRKKPTHLHKDGE